MSAATVAHALALTVACPRCGAVADEPCVDLRILPSGRKIPNQTPHPARIKRARPGRRDHRAVVDPNDDVTDARRRAPGSERRGAA
jgi:hypothetical protein